MSDATSLSPTDDELLAFAQTLLHDLGGGLTAPDVLRESVDQARELWLLLYRVNRDEA